VLVVARGVARVVAMRCWVGKSSAY
jgi:hypothetical protein